MIGQTDDGREDSVTDAFDFAAMKAQGDNAGVPELFVWS